MIDLKTICEQVIESAEKATKRPWERSWLHEVYPGSDSKKEQDENAQYIVTACNYADRLAKACLVMREALESLAIKTEYYCDATGISEIGVWADSAKEALAEVEEIMKGDL